MIYAKVFDILLVSGEDIAVQIISNKHYKTHLDFPFYLNIEKEGILIG
jgi:hypothetical protein